MNFEMGLDTVIAEPATKTKPEFVSLTISAVKVLKPSISFS